MASFSPTTLSLVAIGLSTISIIMSAFSLRRQGIPDKFEVERRAMESLKQTNPDRHVNGFKVVYITVTEEGGLVNTIKKYVEGHIQGQTEVLVTIDNGGFREDFEGEYEYEPTHNHRLSVTVEKTLEVSEHRVLTLDTAGSQDIYGTLQWLLIDIFPQHSTKVSPRNQKPEKQD